MAALAALGGIGTIWYAYNQYIISRVLLELRATYDTDCIRLIVINRSRFDLGLKHPWLKYNSNISVQYVPETMAGSIPSEVRALDAVEFIFWDKDIYQQISGAGKMPVMLKPYIRIANGKSFSGKRISFPFTP